MHAMQFLAAVEVGQYVSPWKIILLLIFLLIWAKLLTWMDKDSIDAHLPRLALNSGMIAGLIAGVLFFLILPTFLVAFSVFLFFLIIDAAVYLLLRHQKVGLSDLSHTFTEWLTGIFSRGDKVPVVAEGDVQLVSKS